MSREHCVLLVEDDADDILFIRRAMKQTGIDCDMHVVGDGDAALDYMLGRGAYADADAYPLPTLVLLDLNLPRRSGLEVLEAIRNHPRRSRMIVVVLTGSRHDAEIAQAYTAGANSYLVKPISPEAMGQLVRTLSLCWLLKNEPAPNG